VRDDDGGGDGYLHFRFSGYFAWMNLFEQNDEKRSGIVQKENQHFICAHALCVMFDFGEFSVRVESCIINNMGGSVGRIPMPSTCCKLFKRIGTLCCSQLETTSEREHETKENTSMVDSTLRMPLRPEP
jgi:hypothetical protein